MFKSLTPLMVDIETMQLRAQEIIQGRRMDDISSSLTHVQLVGLFLELYTNGEMMDQIKWLQKPESEGGGDKEN